jgi:RNA polymerase sigma factor (sigma-70 family)
MSDSEIEMPENIENVNSKEEGEIINPVEKAYLLPRSLKNPLYFNNYAWNKDAILDIKVKDINPKVISLLLTPEENLNFEYIQGIYKDDPITTIASLSLLVDRFQQRRWNSKHYPPHFTPNEEILMFSGYKFLSELDNKSEDEEIDKLQKEIKDEIVIHNVGFVKKKAKQIYNYYHSLYSSSNKTEKIALDDLISIGYIQLITKIDEFKPELGYKFLSYAGYPIQKYISEACQDRYSVHIPANLRLKYNNYTKIYSELTQRLKRLPTYEEIKEYAEKNNQKIPQHSLLIARNNVVKGVKLDQQFLDDENISYYDITPSAHNTEKEAVDNIIRDYIKENLPESLKTLKDTVPINQFTAFLMKYQIDEYLQYGFFSELTYEETGDRLSISSRKAQYRSKKANKNFAVIAEIKGLHDYL